MLLIIFIIYAVLVLPPLAYLLFISIAGMKTPSRNTSIDPATGVIGVFIPAHNEKLTIKRTIESLLAAAKGDENIEINIIADNCTDNTHTGLRGCSISL